MINLFSAQHLVEQANAEARAWAGERRAALQATAAPAPDDRATAAMDRHRPRAQAGAGRARRRAA